MRCYRRSWTRSAVITACFLSAALVEGCRDESTDPTEGTDASFTGITMTDEIGEVLSVDSADWRPLPAVGLTVSPAYPNPCSLTFTLRFSVSGHDSVRATLNQSPSDPRETITSARYSPGLFQVTGYVNQLPPAVYRVYVRVIRQGVVYTTFGDIQVAR